MTVLENLELGAYLRKDTDAIKRDQEAYLGGADACETPV